MSEQLLFGAVADDYTGAADLASMLREQGLRTGLLFGPLADSAIDGVAGRYQALVIALKSRSIPAAAARQQSIGALEQLRRLGSRQLYFKYCSTFDSTAEGNIGPVIDALMTATGTDFTIAVPALPVNGRTQYNGYLFVGGSLISETHMRHHPVTPMTEANLVRHLQSQTTRRVGLIGHAAVHSGPEAIRREIERRRSEGVEIALVDAIMTEDLRSIARAVVDLPLLTGGSGLGMTLPDAWVERGLIEAREPAGFELAGRTGRALIISGSCSVATLQQIETAMSAGCAGVRVEVAELLDDDAGDPVERLMAEITAHLRSSSVAIVYSSAAPDQREESLAAAAARGFEPAEISRRIERVMGEIARRAVEADLVDSFVLAGGETTGAVTQALGVTGVEIGPALEPGVPVARSLAATPVNLVLKSGNFGAPDFFLSALRQLGIANDFARGAGAAGAGARLGASP